MRVLGPFFDAIDADFSALREIARDLLQQEKDLSEIVQLVGRDSLSEDQKVVLELAKIIREDYLQQNAFSEHDFNCPLTKSVGMLRVIVQLYRRALKAVTGSDATGAAAATAAGAKTITWNVIKATQSKLINRVTVRWRVGLEGAFSASVPAHSRRHRATCCFATSPHFFFPLTSDRT